MDIATCYMCDQPEVSKEHVPPKCFFPEQKDLPKGIDYRKNLITVPSCEKHNMSTSKDDEYLLAVIITHHQNNQAAYNHFMSKILRMLKKQTRLTKRIVNSSIPVTMGGQSTALLNAEPNRVNAELNKIACGIHFHHFGVKWMDSIMIDSPDRIVIDEPPQYSIHQLTPTIDKILAMSNTARNGDNPDIFYYQALRFESLPLTMVKMVFYGGFRVFAFSGRAVDQGLAEHTRRQ